MPGALLLSLLLCLLAAYAFPAPTDLTARQLYPSSPHGPPGQLVEPAAGQVYANPGPVRILYERSVTGGWATQSIQADVENTDGGAEALVINALESPNAGTGQYIEAWVAAPTGFCGDQLFLVFETQKAPDGSLVQFQSASPTIHFTCNGGSYPPLSSAHTGPHGSLASPAANKQYTNAEGVGVHIHLKYQRLVTALATTLSLQLALVQGAVSYQLAYALGPTGGLAVPLIEQYFAAPGECLCGTYNLTVDESQLYHGAPLTFRTYSVPLKFACPAAVVALCNG